MALGYLFILFVAIIVISILGIALLYISKNQNIKNITFYTLAIWSVIVAFLNVTSLPSNYIFEKVIGLVFGLLAIISIIIKIKKPEKINIAYLLVSLSILLTVLDLILL